MAKLPSRFKPGWARENAIFRIARKQYTCDGNGGRQPAHSSACPGTINPGDPYIEYVGETPAFQRGSTHSIACAVNYAYIHAAD